MRVMVSLLFYIAVRKPPRNMQGEQSAAHGVSALSFINISTTAMVVKSLSVGKQDNKRVIVWLISCLATWKIDGKDLT